MTRARLLHAAVTMLAVAALAAQPAAGQMPDPQQMSGVPLPVGDVPTGTVTVRVIRGTFANPVSSQTVEIIGAGSPVTASTNDIGRAEFHGLAPGTRVRAAATVAGERLESQEFTVPQTGGIRLILVAPEAGASTAADASAPRTPAPANGAARPPNVAATPATPGTVVLGDDSRFVFEMGEDGLTAFYVLQVRNSSSTPVQPASPLIFELPSDARGAAVMQGSSPQATLNGRTLTIAGPFAPGVTPVQIGYTMPLHGAELTIEQKLPVTLMHLAVVAQKIGDMRLTSPQIAEQRDMPAQGNLYIAARGGAVQAGSVLRFDFTGLPHETTWPRTVAIGLALAVLLGGGWAAFGRGRAGIAAGSERQQLVSRRDRLFDELAALEVRQREGAVDPAEYAVHRRELVGALERIYAALDDEVAMGRAS